MAKLYVTEFRSLMAAPEAGQFPLCPPVVDQTPVAIGVGSAQSAAFDPATRFVRLHADAICSIEFGTNPDADANNMRLAANQTEYFAVSPNHKVAVITNT
jgi:hypothetical protein